LGDQCRELMQHITTTPQRQACTLRDRPMKTLSLSEPSQDAHWVFFWKYICVNMTWNPEDVWENFECVTGRMSRRLAIVQHRRHPPARGLLSLISFLSAFLLTGIKRNQVWCSSPPSPPAAELGGPHERARRGRDATAEPRAASSRALQAATRCRSGAVCVLAVGARTGRVRARE